MHFPGSRLVQTYPAASVTTIDANHEHAPADAGLTQQQVDHIWQAVVRCYESGIHPSMTICIRRHGKIVMNRAIGHTHGNEPGALPTAPKKLATPDSWYSLYSASKAMAAIVLHHLNERGKIHLDDPVCEYLPEFKNTDKRFITVRQILMHSAGVPKIPEGAADLDNLHKKGAIRALMADAELLWPPGTKFGYHALTGGFVTGELVETITGMTIRDYWDQHFRKPMGFESMRFGVSKAQIKKVAPNVYTGVPLPEFGEKVATRVLGVSYREAIELSNDPRFLTAIIPAGNLIGNAEETCRFYEMLLNGGRYNGKRILKETTVRRAVMAQTYWHMDRIMGLPVRYSLGFMLGRSKMSMYIGDTGQVFGHIGMINIVAYADPARDISVAILNNGKPGITSGIYHFWRILKVIADEMPRVPEGERRLSLGT